MGQALFVTRVALIGGPFFVSGHDTKTQHPVPPTTIRMHIQNAT
jgi:hypothetical protein